MPAAQRERAIVTILEELDWWAPELIETGQIRGGAARLAAHDVDIEHDAHDRILPRH